MLDMGRIHQVVLSKKKEVLSIKKESQSLLFSLEYHMNEIEKNKYRSIKKYLPELGFDMVVDEENILKINAIPEGLSETKVIVFLEKLFEILDYKTEEEFMEYYENQWVRIQAKSKFDFLFKPDVEQLLKDFTELGFPEYTPHGKPCYISLPLEDLKNKL